MLPSKLVQCLWQLGKVCTIIRISLPYVQTKPAPTVLTWVTLNFWVPEVVCKVPVLRVTSQLMQMVSGG